MHINQATPSKILLPKELFALVLHDNYRQYMKVNGNSFEIDRKRWIPPISLLDFIQEKSVVKLVGRHELGSVRGRNFFDGVAWKRESSRGGLRPRHR